MKNVISIAMGILGPQYIELAVPMLEGMLAYKEEDRITERNSAMMLNELVTSLESDMGFHCQPVDEEGSSDNIFLEAFSKLQFFGEAR